MTRVCTGLLGTLIFLGAGCGPAGAAQIVGVGGKCLDVSGGSPQDHATLIISTCSSSPSQQWSVQ